MKLLLDTETISSLYNQMAQEHSIVVNKLQEHSQDELCISVLTLFELEYGFANAENMDKNQLRNIIKKVKHRFKILQLSEEAARPFGDLKAFIRKERNLNKNSAKKHNMDIMIACTALLNGCTVISKD